MAPQFLPTGGINTYDNIINATVIINENKKINDMGLAIENKNTRKTPTSKCERKSRQLSTTSLKNSGRPKVTSPQQDEIVESMLTENPLCTAVVILREFERRQITGISLRTIQRRMNKYKNRQKLKETQQINTKLGEAIRVGRLQWALAHQHMSVQEWRSIFNMDDEKHEMDMPRIYLDTVIGPNASPDLSVMENLMAIMMPKLDKCPPKNVGEFRAVIYDFWHSDQNMVDQIELFYASMPMRVQAVIDKNGGDIGMPSVASTVQM